jgi:hypothetical protein
MKPIAKIRGALSKKRSFLVLITDLVINKMQRLFRSVNINGEIKTDAYEGRPKINDGSELRN